MYRFNDFRVENSNVVQLAVEYVSFEYNIFVLNSVRMLTNSLCLNLMKLKLLKVHRKQSNHLYVFDMRCV